MEEYARLLLSRGEYFHFPSDFYGNVKIPDLYRLKDYNEDDVEWTAVRSDNNTAYSSLMGVPVSGVPTIGKTTFTIETSYYSVMTTLPLVRLKISGSYIKDTRY